MEFTLTQKQLEMRPVYELVRFWKTKVKGEGDPMSELTSPGGNVVWVAAFYRQLTVDFSSYNLRFASGIAKQSVYWSLPSVCVYVSVAACLHYCTYRV